jgi:hypothetical protein
MVDRLSNGDITKHEAVYETNLFYCLDVLSYYKDRDKYQEHMHKKMMSRYGK